MIQIATNQSRASHRVKVHVTLQHQIDQDAM